MNHFCSSAEIRKDVSSQYHNSLYTGDVAERIKILKSVGQGQRLQPCEVVYRFNSAPLLFTLLTFALSVQIPLPT